MTVQDTTSYELLASYFQNSSLFPNGTDISKRVLLSLYRALAKGKPVHADELASSLELENATVRDVLKEVAPSNIVYDKSSLIIGYRGLSLEPSNHQLTINGIQLYAWCAFDCLFLPELLQRSISIVSKCPETGSDINISLSPTTILSQSHKDIFVSFVTPDLSAYSDNLRGNFCCHVNFFASKEAGFKWAEKNKGITLVDLDSAIALAHIRNVSGFGTALT